MEILPRDDESTGYAALVTSPTCSDTGCGKPVHALGKCARHYSRDYKRSRNGHVPNAHRPPLDDVVYKLRYRQPSGLTRTIYYSDPGLANTRARRLRRAGDLLFFAQYDLASVTG